MKTRRLARGVPFVIAALVFLQLRDGDTRRASSFGWPIAPPKILGHGRIQHSWIRRRCVLAAGQQLETDGTLDRVAIR
jgi:hypothetical protein